MSVKVAIQGYGTIGKRVADAVARQKDMTVVGVSKTRPSYEARAAVAKGYKLYLAAGAKREEFDAAGVPVAGTTSEMLAQAEIVVDCAPDKVGKENARLYEAAKLPAIFQGGEKADVAEVSFSALANYDAARGKRRVRVVLCNTTGLARAVSVLGPAFGIDHWGATLVRRAADPPETKKGPINGILPTFQLPSHHGPDVQTIYPSLSIATTAVVVPTTLMHVHVNHVRLARPPASAEAVLDRFRRTPRFHIFEAWEHIDGTPQVMECARDRGGARSDMMENVLWQAGIRLDGSDLFFFQAIHQESIVVPENVDAIRAILGLAPDAASSIALTDAALGIPRPG
jgi:glyceraldehyde-3-phosphate dehydrogenase (NAD(P))